MGSQIMIIQDKMIVQDNALNTQSSLNKYYLYILICISKILSILFSYSLDIDRMFSYHPETLQFEASFHKYCISHVSLTMLLVVFVEHYSWNLKIYFKRTIRLYKTESFIHHSYNIICD